MKKFHFILYLFTLTCFSSFAQNERIEGKIIKDFGQTFAVKNLDIKTNISDEFKVIFDVTKSSENKSVRNRSIETAARFLNMHANEGMKLKQLHAAITIHGGAWQDVMTNEAYHERFGLDNPNLKLINQLSEAGVDIIICGQTAGARGLNKINVNPNVKFALSAMTALIQYQNNGYRFIKL